MIIDHPSRDIWTSVPEEIRERRYGPGSEYDADDLLADLESEGSILNDDELEQVYDDLLEDMPVTGEDIEEKLEEYSTL